MECPQRDQDRNPKGAEGEDMSLYSVRNYLLGFRRISEVDILVQKSRISTVPWKIGIPELKVRYVRWVYYLYMFDNLVMPS